MNDTVCVEEGERHQTGLAHCRNLLLIHSRNKRHNRDELSASLLVSIQVRYTKKCIRLVTMATCHTLSKMCFNFPMKSTNTIQDKLNIYALLIMIRWKRPVTYISFMNSEHILSAVVNLASSSYGSHKKNVKTHRGSLAVSFRISVGRDVFSYAIIANHRSISIITMCLMWMSLARELCHFN